MAVLEALVAIVPRQPVLTATAVHRTHTAQATVRLHTVVSRRTEPGTLRRLRMAAVTHRTAPAMHQVVRTCRATHHMEQPTHRRSRMDTQLMATCRRSHRLRLILAMITFPA